MLAFMYNHSLWLVAFMYHCSAQDTIKTNLSAPRSASNRQSTASDTTLATNTTPAEKFRNWRSQSASKVRHRSSSKIRSSGFTSYLDGPVEPVEPVSGDSLPPTPPPPSPLHEMSYFLKANNVPDGNHLQPAPCANHETVQFWEMVQR